MRLTLIVCSATALLGCGTPGTRSARVSAPPAGATRCIPDGLAQLDAELARAYANRDTTALERLISPDFEAIHADGRVDSKSRWISSAGSGSLMFQRAEREDYEPDRRFHANGTALETSRILFRLPAQGLGLWMRRTSVYVCNGAGWQLAFMQSTLLHEGLGGDPATFDQYAGEYEIDPGKRVVVRRNRSELVADLPTGTAQMFETAPDVFKVSRNSQLKFTRDPTGDLSEVVLVRDAKELWRARRLPR